RSLQLYEAAVAYYKRKDYENSRKFFEKALQYDPENKDAKHNLAVVEKQMALIDEDKRTKQEKKDNAINKSLSQISEDILKQAANTEEKDEAFYCKALRLDSDSTEEEIRSRINSEFRKWRTRINSQNIKMRSEAEEMLAIISQARRKLLK
ncbi:MAG: tetratricopeptide repeat protein, partial [Candidatus Delongbacteria bacterium]|nr:tetratricopeptide repeat protein [Candidatus Delongbacteria bacterium]